MAYPQCKSAMLCQDWPILIAHCRTAHTLWRTLFGERHFITIFWKSKGNILNNKNTWRAHFRQRLSNLERKPPNWTEKLPSLKAIIMPKLVALRQTILQNFSLLHRPLYCGCGLLQSFPSPRLNSMSNMTALRQNLTHRPSLPSVRVRSTPVSSPGRLPRHLPNLIALCHVKPYCRVFGPWHYTPWVEGSDPP